MTGQVEFRRGSLADLPLLEPLWVSVHHHHAQVMPDLAPYVDDRQTWAVRSQLYAELLAKPETVLLLASADGAVIGYGLAHVSPASGTWVADTWQTGDRIGEIESLAIQPGYRGQGIGSRLLTALTAELATAGVRDLVLGVLPGNDAAIRLYQRQGFRPTWTYLSRFTGR
ncbi:MAG TPA: GNAT family N-acetyltransferase [Streptosporangiaceae bacterium]|jgi:ribosomal protein S18 acetylase RimI-like enzyme|nr:GNAT family N-acetyltransferase [Streptosporangiaceae bacterium]